MPLNNPSFKSLNNLFNAQLMEKMYVFLPMVKQEVEKLLL